MLCEKCGRKISDDETLCPKCAKGMQARESVVSADSSSEAKSNFYSHSGRINPLVLILGFPLVLIASIILSFVYAYAVVYIPILGYLSFLLTFGFAFGVGYSTAFILRFFKTRNTLFAAVFGLFSGIFALYAAWVAFEYVLISRSEEISLIKLAFNPLAVWGIACNIAETGWYSIKKVTPKGAVLWTFWAIEALAIIGCAVYMAYSFIKDMVFCEACGVWTKDHTKKLEFEYLSENELKEKLIQHDLTFLKDMIKLKRTDSEFYRITCSMCAKCSNLFALSLFRIIKSWDNEGKETEKKVAILQNLLISQELFEKLTNFKKTEAIETAEESTLAADAAAQAEAEANVAEASEEGDAE